MSKISDENWVKEILARYWKRSAALGTAWLRRYKDDPFFRTEVNAIALQIAFAVFMVAVVGTSFSLLNRDVSTAIVAGIKTGLATSSPTAVGPTIVDQIESIRAQNLAVVIGLIIFATAVFGYIIARITLTPARNALAAQKQFIGNIAHELRTPLSIIKTNTEITLLQTRLDKDLKETLESNVEELDRISEIINNLLSLNALINPERIEFTTIDLSTIADEVAQKYARLAAVGKHVVTIERTSGSRIVGNSTAMRQIVGNLLKNAITYTPERGAIVIAIAPVGTDIVELSIRDTGVGISRRDLERIFEPFYRADQSRTRANGGSGLGLAIVSELVKMHGGTISMQSTVGVGTSVTIRFPAAAAYRHENVPHKKSVYQVIVDLSKGRV